MPKPTRAPRQESRPAPRGRTKKRRLSRYAKGLIAFTFLLAILVTIVLFVLWNILSNYEKTTPRAALDAYFSNLYSQKYDPILKESGFVADELNTEEDYIALLHSIYGSDSQALTYRQVAMSSEEPGQKYAVYSGEEKLGEVILIADEKARHGWTARSAYDYMLPYTITAPGHAEVMVNGQPLSQQDPDAVITPVATFVDLPDPEQIPYTVTYQTEPTLAIPEFFAATPGGLPCDVTVDQETHTVNVAVPVSQEQIDAYTPVAESVSKVYANYVSEDASFGDLSVHLYPDTPLFGKMGSFYAGWYANHDSFAFRDMVVSNFVSTSDTTFTADISFVYEVYMGAEMHEFPTLYHLSFAQYNGEWRLLDLQTQ